MVVCSADHTRHSSSLYLLVDEDMCQETDDDEGETAPCIDVLVSHVAHSWNKRTEYLQHSTQCDK